jgi:NADH:ubiquinone oxidoreductase subunit 3 (subunit A)
MPYFHPAADIVMPCGEHGIKTSPQYYSLALILLLLMRQMMTQHSLAVSTMLNIGAMEVFALQIFLLIGQLNPKSYSPAKGS